MPQLNVAIIDYKLSNLFSVAHACDYVGLNAKITSDPIDIKNADALILPGVGAFADAISNLRKFKLIDPLLDHINKRKPFMGVCLGLQLLFEESDEFGIHKGLGVLKGNVKKLPDKSSQKKLIRVPHIGWDKVHLKSKSSYFKDFNDQDFAYFVHSYYVNPKEFDIIAGVTNYEGFEFVSAVQKGNLFAVQFHPEKSGPKGPLLYKNFALSVK